MTAAIFIHESDQHTRLVSTLLTRRRGRGDACRFYLFSSANIFAMNLRAFAAAAFASAMRPASASSIPFLAHRSHCWLAAIWALSSLMLRTLSARGALVFAGMESFALLISISRFR